MAIDKETVHAILHQLDAWKAECVQCGEFECAAQARDIRDSLEKWHAHVRSTLDLTADELEALVNLANALQAVASFPRLVQHRLVQTTWAPQRNDPFLTGICCYGVTAEGGELLKTITTPIHPVCEGGTSG